MTAGGAIPAPEERVRLDPYVRVLGRVTDMDGALVHVGVNYDTVTIAGAEDSVFTQEMAEEFGRLFVAACWQAGANKKRMDEEAPGG